MFDKLRGLLSADVPLVALDEGPQPLDRAARLAPGERYVRVDLGRRALRLGCERRLGVPDTGADACWVLEEADDRDVALRPAMRIPPGERVLLGRENERVQRLFDLPRSLPRRQLELRNDGRFLTIRNLAPDRPVTLASAGEQPTQQALRTSRLAALSRLRELFGGRLEPLDAESALADTRSVVELLRDESHRPKDSRGRGGGLLELPAARVPLVMGDLHAQLDNLLRVLCEGRCLDALERGDAYLLLLGDTVHREDDAELEEMETSLLMLDFLCRLKLRYPASVFWLRGNHESFREDVGKSGIPQGLLLRSAARERRGEDYLSALTELFESLPYVARSDDFIACHGGPPRGAISVQALIDIHEHPALAEQLVWIRPRRAGHPAGFVNQDVVRLRAGLGAAKRSPVIVGHTPLAEEGVLWVDAAEMPGLHIVFDARTGTVPVFTRGRGGIVALELPSEPLLALSHSAGDD